jgi:hypothetical protein
MELDPIAKAGGFNGFYGPNWYGYAEGNPLRWTDPPGLDATVTDLNLPFPWHRNGNWGGKCWSGGRYSCDEKGPGTEPPTDSGDEVYLGHDYCYWECTGIRDGALRLKCEVLCDRQSRKELIALPEDPMRWPRPPKPEHAKETKEFCDGAKGYWNR